MGDKMKKVISAINLVDELTTGNKLEVLCAEEQLYSIYMSEQDIYAWFTHGISYDVWYADKETTIANLDDCLTRYNSLFYEIESCYTNLKKEESTLIENNNINFSFFVCAKIEQDILFCRAKMIYDEVKKMFILFFENKINKGNPLDHPIDSSYLFGKKIDVPHIIFWKNKHAQKYCRYSKFSSYIKSQIKDSIDIINMKRYSLWDCNCYMRDIYDQIEKLRYIYMDALIDSGKIIANMCLTNSKPYSEKNIFYFCQWLEVMKHFKLTVSGDVDHHEFVNPLYSCFKDIFCDGEKGQYELYHDSTYTFGGFYDPDSKKVLKM